MPVRLVCSSLFWFLSMGVALFGMAVVGMATTFGFEGAAPHLAHYLQDYSVPLYAHIIAGPLALCLMPFQFWQGLRSRHRLVHRSIGYGYAASIAVGSIASLLMLPRFEGSAWAATGFAVLAVGWFATTARAIFLARAGDYQSHRAWMLRSAALTFAAVTLRLMMLPLIAGGMTITETYDITAWASWLLPLLAVEWTLRRPRQTASRAAFGTSP